MSHHAVSISKFSAHIEIDSKEPWNLARLSNRYQASLFRLDSIDQDDVIAALEHRDRVFCIELNITGSQPENMATVLHKPFPVLTHLDISSEDGNLVIPGGFLGGSAPCLEQITSSCTCFPALPTLLLSTKNLVKLKLYFVPPTHYISPSAMVACLAEWPKLNTLFLHFTTSVTVCLGQILPPPITRVVLPALADLYFCGASKYLEDLLAQIDCPELDYINVYIINLVADFQIAPFARFLNRSVDLEMSPYSPTEVNLVHGSVAIRMFCDPNLPYEVWKPEGRRATIAICYGWTDPQVSLIAEVVNRFSAILFTVVHLSLTWPEYEEIDDIDWLHLLHPFSTLQTLLISRILAWEVASALEDIPAERVTEVLPSLCLAYLERYPGSFLEIKLSDSPVEVVYDRMDYTKILDSGVLRLPTGRRH